MKILAIAAVLVVAGTSVAPAKDRSPPGKIHAAFALLQQKLQEGPVAAGTGIAVDLRQSSRPPGAWYYIDALYCGWEAKNGTTYFYAGDGNTWYWDVTGDHMLATAMAISCAHGDRLYAYFYAKGKFNETQSTTYP